MSTGLEKVEYLLPFAMDNYFCPPSTWKCIFTLLLHGHFVLSPRVILLSLPLSLLKIGRPESLPSVPQNWFNFPDSPICWLNLRVPSFAFLRYPLLQANFLTLELIKGVFIFAFHLVWHRGHLGMMWCHETFFCSKKNITFMLPRFTQASPHILWYLQSPPEKGEWKQNSSLMPNVMPPP